MKKIGMNKILVIAILSFLLVGGMVVIPQTASAHAGVGYTSSIYSEINGTNTGTQSLGYNAIEFTVGSTPESVNFLTFWAWHGKANFTYSIGTALLSDNILANRSYNFTAHGWQNVSFPVTSLSANTDYYLGLYETWSSGGTDINYTTTPTVNKGFVEDYGAYTFSALTTGGYTTTPIIYSIGFSSTIYSITYTETGLSSGTNWSVNQSGVIRHSTTSKIVYDEPNGSYSFSVPSIPDYTLSPSSGTVTVNGANMTEAITFTPMPKYAVNFTETGLPSKTLWAVNLSGTLQSTNRTYIVFDEFNGTYSYSIGLVPGYRPLISSGSVTVSGTEVTKAINFTQVKYSIDFKETGLVNGTKWLLNVSGIMYNSTTEYLNISAPNGTYTYSVIHLTGYKNNETSGSAKINGSSVSVPVQYLPFPLSVMVIPSKVPYDTAVTLYSNGSTAYTASITNYTWRIKGPQNFTEYSKNPSLFFSLTGSYSVSLTVTSSSGLTNTSSHNLSVIASQSDSSIIISMTSAQLSNGTYELSYVVNAKDNVSISSFTVQVNGKYVNATLTKQAGYEYYYTVWLVSSKYAYGNYTIRATAWNSLDNYNSLTKYLTFGSISEGGLLSYITSHSLIAVVFGLVVVLVIIFIFAGTEHFEVTHRRKKGRR